MFAFSGIEVQPETRVRIPIAGTVSIIVDLRHEFIGCPHQFVGIERRKWKSETADAAVMAGFI
jgi:hypothetical protein